MALPPQKSGQPKASSAFDPAQPGEAQSLGDAVRYNEELTREVAALEEQVELLKVRYEQWFMGIERREPAREREEAKREVNRLKTAFTRNTGLRFRIQSLHARFISYERMWQRSAREKEEGTYRRDVLRARRAAQRAADEARRAAGGAGPDAATPGSAAPDAPGAAAGSAAAPAAGSSGVSQGPKSAAPAPRTATQPAAAAPPLPAVPGLTPAQLRTLHSTYVGAKQRCNEDTSRLTVDALARSLAKQVPELLSKFRAHERRVPRPGEGRADGSQGDPEGLNEAPGVRRPRPAIRVRRSRTRSPRGLTDARLRAHRSPRSRCPGGGSGGQVRDRSSRGVVHDDRRGGVVRRPAHLGGGAGSLDRCRVAGARRGDRAARGAAARAPGPRLVLAGDADPPRGRERRRVHEPRHPREAIRVAEQRNQVRYAERGRRRVASAAAVPQ